MENNQGSFEIILHAGNSKTFSLEAIEFAEKGQFVEANSMLEQAQKEIVLAHEGHSEELVKLAQGEEVQVDLIMMHAQDHLATATLLHTIAEKLINVHKELKR